GSALAGAPARPGALGLAAPVEAPLVDHGSGIQQPVAVGSPEARLPRTLERPLRDLARWDLVAPRRARARRGRPVPAAQRELALGVGRQTPAPARGGFGQPVAERDRVVPAHADDGPAVAGEARVRPPRRRGDAPGREEGGELPIRHRGPSEEERTEEDRAA